MKRACEHEPRAFTLHLKWKHDGMFLLRIISLGVHGYYALSMRINWVRKIKIDFVKIKFHLNDIACNSNWI
jgi:hypothetical protein